MRVAASVLRDRRREMTRLADPLMPGIHAPLTSGTSGSRRATVNALPHVWAHAGPFFASKTKRTQGPCCENSRRLRADLRLSATDTDDHGSRHPFYPGLRCHRARSSHHQPSVPISPYRDVFGNWCSRIVAPAGRMRLSADGVVRDTGLPDVIASSATQHKVEELPAETLIYLLGSRYCETDRLSDAAWNLFENSPPGWARVQAICDFVHHHITFGYEHARPTMTALGCLQRRQGRVPRLRPSRHRVLPLHEYSGALLHRLSGRYRHSAALWPDGFRRLV